MRTATGLANSDFIPFVYPIVPFAVLRQLEFIRNIGKPGTHVDHLASHTRRAFVVLPSHTTGRMKPIEMHPTPCPISGEEGDATEIYPANFNAASLSPAIFSARRVPDRIHFRIVCSNRSGLVRSDPVADQVLIYDLYKQSSFDYAQSSTQRW